MQKTFPILCALALTCSPVWAAQKNDRPKLIDAKRTKTGNPEPPKDPDLEQYAIFEKTAPYPKPGKSVDTKLPLKLKQGDKICFVGNTLFDRASDMGHFETLLQQAHPNLKLKVRNLAWSADEIFLQPRPDNFGTMDQHLTVQKADVIFAAFGYNESFAGKEGLADFSDRLEKFVGAMKSSAYNGKTGPRIVLVSPVANENVQGVKAADLNNANIAAYTKAMSAVARKTKVSFVNVFNATRKAMADPRTDLTFNGAHMLENGYAVFGKALFKGAFGNQKLPPLDEKIRAEVVEKNGQWFYRYRPLNTFYYTGGRNKRYGYLDFLPAMRNFEIMVNNREKRIWDLSAGRPVSTDIDDSNVPKLDQVAESLGANEWLTPADELKAFDVDPRFEVNLFASEEEFPDIACPIQIRWDSRGRLWVACSTTYPHVYPGNKPNDKIVILEDTDGDGKADKSHVWADDVHIPLSFELGDGGIYVSEEPHITFLKDTDGDGKADFRRKIYTGFGTEDSHHALHDFVWTPDGDLLFRESIFHNSQVETPYGPVRAKNSAWFRYRPDTHRLVTFGNYPNTNPWGVTYDDWGHHVASHPIFASVFHATNPKYPTQHPRPNGIPAYSGTAGHEFIDFPNWPEEYQGGFAKARYKPNNRVEFHKWVEHDDHFEEKYQFDIIFSRNLSFIPVDLRYGPRGAMYVCDWYNPIKGHAQYALRDPRRDRKSGRIWRIIPKGMKLQDPPKFEGASTTQLVNLLKRPEYRYRYWAKRELRDRDPQEVKRALDQFLSRLNPGDQRHRHHQLEAVWGYRNVGLVNAPLLQELLNCDNHNARAGATRQLRYWHEQVGSAELTKRANDNNGLVRMEAALAATYIGTPQAAEAVIAVSQKPSSQHLQYAVATAFGAESIARHLRNDSAKKPDLDRFFAGFKKASKRNKGRSVPSAVEAAFDNQKGIQAVEISCVPERMLFTVKRFEVNAGKPVKLTFTNPDVTQHNLVIVKPGAAMEIGMAGNMMATQKDGLKKHFIPPSDKILHHTKLLKQDTTEVLRFTAPTEPGNYPYVCTFPGHWLVMNGEMIVE
ncbi:MAG: PVC-type heme-binding CxxCH protein [Limisphaerales bacterium]